MYSAVRSLSTIDELLVEYAVPASFHQTLIDFFPQFCSSLQQGKQPMERGIAAFKQFLSLLQKQVKFPHRFGCFHEKVTSPFDYHAFGKEFVELLFDKKQSMLFGHAFIREMEASLERQENVIVFANHQTEIDPQLLFLLLEEHFPHLASEIIFVGGDRIVSDPMAVPFSLGCNLLTVHSKQYMDGAPEEKRIKQLHNLRTMEATRQLLSEGRGKCICVFPSGGRDRVSSDSRVLLSSFDPQSIELFFLTAKKAKRPTHFYPLALSTYAILPPPLERKLELGETRSTFYSPIGIAFGPTLDCLFSPHAFSDETDKKAVRRKRAHCIENLTKQLYESVYPILSRDHYSFVLNQIEEKLVRSCCKEQIGITR